MAIVVKNLTKRFGDFIAVDRVSFDVQQGELVALLGPSGSGKSTILRMISGLTVPDEGEIFLTGEDATMIPIQKRGVGFVFQHYALFKHMTVAQNIAFGLEVQKHDRAAVKERVEELLKLVQLQGYGNHYPSELSGGQRQRVALARALAPRPKVLLLDEPFGALDARVREELRTWIRKLHDEFHVTSVFVTHDQNEALEISDKIVVVNQGRIEQIGTPQEIYEHPKTSFVAGFVGPVNILRGSIEAGKAKIGQFEFDVEHGESAAVEALIRPSDILISKPSGEQVPTGLVRRISFLGWGIKVDILLKDGQSLAVHLTKKRYQDLQLREGQEIFIQPTDARVFTQGAASRDYSI
ncbi:MAG: sulfate ABC transporter ATP-binding protein [Candidatus Omnitrophica bacterium]|nr:sulfate ABC transporter ATP-binding protein [Candidatus Omnitrophota bacterium]